MRKFTFILILLIAFIACKDKKVDPIRPIETEKESETPTEAIKPSYPENLIKVLDAHGGLATWKEMRTLEFSVENPDGFEITTTDLKERYSLVEMPKHTIGFDGESVWIKSAEGAKYAGDPKFYYNLMFYFYAMPFVLADSGIKYSDVEALTIDGKSYPGIKISFNNGIGTSSDDEFIMYYDADTNKMSWLSYLATFGNKAKGKEWHFIKYSNWQEAEGLLLPKTMSWYNFENNKPTTKLNDVEFSHVSLSRDEMNSKMYMMPEGAQEIQ